MEKAMCETPGHTGQARPRTPP